MKIETIGEIIADIAIVFFILLTLFLIHSPAKAEPEGLHRETPSFLQPQKPKERKPIAKCIDEKKRVSYTTHCRNDQRPVVFVITY